MGEAYILRRGGAGGLSLNNAVIHVTAPVGSTISFAKGGVTAKVLGPDKSHVNADDNTLADWYYSVSSSNYGTWTVTASRSGLSVSRSLVIDSNKSYDIRISYDFTLLTAGVLASGYSIGGGFSSGSGRISVGATDGRNLGYITPKINVSGFSSLYIDIYTTVNATSGNPYKVGLKADTANNDTFAASYNNTFNSGEHKTQVDISELDGEYYFAVTVYSGSQYHCALGVRNVILYA